MQKQRFAALMLCLALAGWNCNIKPLQPVTDEDKGAEQVEKEETTKTEPETPSAEEPEPTEEPEEEVTKEEPKEETPEEVIPVVEEKPTSTGYDGKVIGTLSLKADADSIVVFLTAEKADYKGKDAYMEFGCESLLVPIKKIITKTQSDLAEALVQLITIKQNAYEEQGLRNAVAPSAPTIKLTNIHYEGKTRVIDFEGQFTSGGACDDPRIKAQIEETVKLYVTDYQIRLNGEEKQWRCLFDASGLCS